MLAGWFVWLLGVDWGVEGVLVQGGALLSCGMGAIYIYLHVVRCGAVFDRAADEGINGCTVVGGP